MTKSAYAYIERINSFRPLIIESEICISYKKGKIYYHQSINDKPKLLGELPLSKIKRILICSRLVERFLRIEPRGAIKVDDINYLISFYGSIYLINIEQRTVVKEHSYRSEMKNPLSFCKIEDIDGFDDCIVYGEYLWNTSKGEVSIFKRIRGEWKRAYTFDKDVICHIHGLIASKERNSVFILTGDSDDESGIWEARDNFELVEPVLTGKQKYRACVGFCDEDGLLYATDTPLERNYLFNAMCVEGQWSAEKLYELPGPVIYGTKYGDNYIFATSVEPDSSLPKIQYFFTRKLGNGVQDRYVHIIAGNLKEGFLEIARFKKDWLPMWLFQFGNVQFPYIGSNINNLIAYPAAVIRYDNKTIILKIPITMGVRNVN